MRMIQSCWSCNQRNFLTFNAGWYAPEYHLMGWALSCLQLKKYYNEVTLYTDSAAAKILIDALQLPYAEVICDMDDLNSYNPGLWALPKIYAYSQQTAAFLHVDSDVFIWKPFDDGLLNRGLIAQNKEVGTQYYETIMQSLERGLTYFPSEIIAERTAGNPILAYNAGIIGGHDIEFFEFYAQKAKEFVNYNIDDFSKIDVYNFNIFFEQYLFYCLAKKNNKNVSVLIPDVIADLEYAGFGDFIEVPHNKKYVHMVGVYKRHPKVCEQLACRLRQDYPEYYYRIIALLKNKNVPLKKDYYHFLDDVSEKYLTSRYFQIKNQLINSETTIAERHNNIVSVAQQGTIEKMVIDAITAIRNNTAIVQNPTYTKQIKDVKIFEAKLALIKNKFAACSKEYLYARDIASTQCFEILFKDKQSYSTNMLIADTLTEQLSSKFNWAVIQPHESYIKQITELLNAKPAQFLTIVVPECDVLGYSLISIDTLDNALLEFLQNPITITELLNEAKSFFDPSDLEESLPEFELLIIGRIKMALTAKLIKVI